MWACGPTCRLLSGFISFHFSTPFTSLTLPWTPWSTSSFPTFECSTIPSYFLPCRSVFAVTACENWKNPRKKIPEAEFWEHQECYWKCLLPGRSNTYHCFISTVKCDKMQSTFWRIASTTQDHCRTCRTLSLLETWSCDTIISSSSLVFTLAFFLFFLPFDNRQLLAYNILFPFNSQS